MALQHLHLLTRTLVAGGSFVFASPLHAEVVFGLLEDGLGIVRFDTAAPAVFLSSTPITGLAQGESISGIDFRVLDRQLYALSSDFNLYTISLAGGGATASRIGTGGTLSPAGGAIGFDVFPSFYNDGGNLLTFSPIRITTSDGSNRLINPETGEVFSVGAALSYSASDANAGSTPNIVTIAHDPNRAFNVFPPRLFGIDSTLGVMVSIDPYNSGTLQTVGSLGTTVGPASSMDVAGVSRAAYLHNGNNGFFSLNLQTGSATLVGNSQSNLSGIALLPTVPLYWDNDLTTPGLGGSGIWTQGENWTYDSAGNGPNFAWQPAAAAIFDGSPGTIEVQGTLTSRPALTFLSDGYVIQGSGNFASSSAMTIDVVDSSHTATIRTDINASSFFKSGEGTLILSGDHSIGGNIDVNRGTLSVEQGGIVTPTGNLSLNNSGALEISGGAKFRTNVLITNPTEGSDTYLKISGAGSELTNTFVQFGNVGTATMEILDGGRFRTLDRAVTAIGESALQSATITIDGPGSTWFVNRDLHVASAANTDVHVRNGGLLDTGHNSAIGLTTGSNGKVFISGEGSRWNVAGDLGVGSAGAGKLEISGGARVDLVANSLAPGGSNLGLGIFSDFSGGAVPSGGEITVTGPGSTLSVLDSIGVGVRGAGQLNIRDGALVSSGGSVVAGVQRFAEDAIGNGKILVEGQGSRLEVAQSLVIGAQVPGELVITAGGHVEAREMVVGAEETGSGSLFIRGETPGTITADSISGGLGTGFLIFDHTAENYQFSTPLAGSLLMHHEGTGTTVLSGDHTHTGYSWVKNGTLIMEGTAATSVFYVSDSGTLRGSGMAEQMIVEPGGTFIPGSGMSAFNTEILELQDGGIMRIALTATGHNQVRVNGAVTLAGGLSLTAGFDPTIGNLFFILLNDGTESINGTFDGLADGSEIFVDDQTFLISYQANWDGDPLTSSFLGGNDVALMAIPEPTSASLFALGFALLLRRQK